MNRWKTRWAALPIAIAFGAARFSLVAPAACSKLLGIQEGRYVGDDAGASDAATSPFDCLSLPDETLEPDPVTLQLQIVDPSATLELVGSVDGGADLTAAVYTPVPAVTVIACPALDPGCTSPVTSPLVSDDAGVVTLDLYGNFIGFLRGTSPTIVPFSFFPGQWLTGTKEASYFTTATTPSDEALVSAILGNVIDLDAGSGLGEVFITVYDCFDHTIPGVTFAMSHSGGAMLPFYIISDIPSATAQVTDGEGTGGAFNVPEGSLTVTATVIATGTTLGSLDVYVRPGEITIGWIRARVH